MILISGMHDVDADGILDKDDNCIDIPNPSQEDSDLDSLGNECDADDDNDGIVDGLDVFDTEKNEWIDFDFDGIGSNSDLDDDNDGILDSDDSSPILQTEVLTKKYLDKIQDCVVTVEESARLLCYKTFFGKLVENEGNNLDALELALALTKVGAVDDCHFISHQIGHEAFENNPVIYENLVGIDDSICRGGFFHGIMAAYFHELYEQNQDISGYKTICNDFIGNSKFSTCIHGLGHGLTHYFLYDLNSAIVACDQMSFYQSSICIGGVMMQYTDNKLTKSRSIINNVPEICSKSFLRIYDYQQCNDNLGLSIAFHTNHNYEKGAQICNMITDEMGRQYCFRGLEREIKDAKDYKEYIPALEDKEELLQTFSIKDDSNKWLIDFRTPSLISDFVYIEETKTMKFSFDQPNQIIIYASTDLLPETLMITVNGEIPNGWEIKRGLPFNHSMIRIMPETSGTIIISGT